MLDRDWLGAALRRGGALTAGRVAAVRASPWKDTALSHLELLEVDYAPGAAGLQPRRMLAKRVHKAFSGVGAREERFFIAMRDAGLPAVRCHGWGRAPDTRVPVLLLEDLQPTHRDPSTPWPRTPPLTEVCAALDALARVHAAAVGPRAAALPRVERPERWVRSWVARARSCLPGFLTRHGPIPGIADPAAWLAALPEAVTQAHADATRWTLLHGDAHHWNALHPRRTGHRGALWIDWQLWRAGLPAFDVAWMLGVNSDPDWRWRNEGTALAFYREAAGQAGVPISAARFEQEVCLALAFHLTVPITLSCSDVPDSLWHGMVQRGAAALSDAGGLARALG
ncbi:MAG: phosphotransferase [Myxococcota bacterium]|nr:phosphotransferase [Myxococcota bacterium]